MAQPTIALIWHQLDTLEAASVSKITKTQNNAVNLPFYNNGYILLGWLTLLAMFQSNTTHKRILPTKFKQKSTQQLFQNILAICW